MARWALLLDRPPGEGPYRKQYELMATIDGEREEAEARFAELVRLYQPRHPMYPVRMRRYRTGDGWMLIGDGSSGGVFTYHFLFTELEWDSGPIAY
ncbi:hypothetical protein [Streptomyces sp. NPDC048521]|uniref:hypothetical protein n=1 Tax=Streptomyces sp. NPDC048521 TaxID=3365566 RepID=UPI0037160F3D